MRTDGQDFGTPCHFGSSHFLFKRARCFPVHERFWFCLVQVSTTQFCSFPSFLMARASDGTNVPISAAPASSSKFVGVPTVLFLTWKEQDFAPVRWRRKPMKFTDSYRSSCRMRLQSKIASKRLLRQWPPRLPRLPILNKLLESLWLASLL